MMPLSINSTTSVSTPQGEKTLDVQGTVDAMNILRMRVLDAFNKAQAVHRDPLTTKEQRQEAVQRYQDASRQWAMARGAM